MSCSMFNTSAETQERGEPSPDTWLSYRLRSEYSSDLLRLCRLNDVGYLVVCADELYDMAALKFSLLIMDAR